MSAPSGVILPPTTRRSPSSPSSGAVLAAVPGAPCWWSTTPPPTAPVRSPSGGGRAHRRRGAASRGQDRPRLRVSRRVRPRAARRRRASGPDGHRPLARPRRPPAPAWRAPRLVIGSRYVPRGGVEDWGALRRTSRARGATPPRARRASTTSPARHHALAGGRARRHRAGAPELAGLRLPVELAYRLRAASWSRRSRSSSGGARSPPRCRPGSRSEAWRRRAGAAVRSRTCRLTEVMNVESLAPPSRAGRTTASRSRAGAGRPLAVVRPWVLLSVAVAVTLLTTIWAVAELSTPDPRRLLPGLAWPGRRLQ